MNAFQKIIEPDNVVCDVEVRSKKHCLELLSGLLAKPHRNVSEDEVFESLVERERLGCTGVGGGIAFPHCRVSGAGGSTGALIRLPEPVEFEAPDGLPVDLVVGLLVPAELDESHRNLIGEVTRLLGDEDLRRRLRAAQGREALYAALVADPVTHPRSRRAQG
jgi:nitrogen PTS system EIIA component